MSVSFREKRRRALMRPDKIGAGVLAIDGAERDLRIAEEEAALLTPSVQTIAWDAEDAAAEALEPADGVEVKASPKGWLMLPPRAEELNDDDGGDAW